MTKEQVNSVAEEFIQALRQDIANAKNNVTYIEGAIKGAEMLVERLTAPTPSPTPVSQEDSPESPV